MAARIVAEIADNHGGDLKLAKEFIRVAAAVGVDCVKFQSWQIKRLRDPSQEPMYHWIQHAELSDEIHSQLMEECQKQGIQFLTTVFDVHRVDFLASLGLNEIKVPSPDLGNMVLLEALKGRFDHIIVSTGMHYTHEVAQAAQILRGSDFTFLHCVSIYPHSPEKANLRRIEWLRQFTPKVGFSDHSNSLVAAKIALAMGITYLERHFCLGKYGPGRVNPWDTTPEQMEELVDYCHRLEAALGTSEPPLTEQELAARKRFIGRWNRDE